MCEIGNVFLGGITSHWSYLLPDMLCKAGVKYKIRILIRKKEANYACKEIIWNTEKLQLESVHIFYWSTNKYTCTVN